MLFLGLSTISSAQTQDSILLANKILQWEDAVSEGNYSKAFDLNDQACALAKHQDMLNIWLDLKSQRGILLGSFQKNQYEAWNFFKTSLQVIWRTPQNRIENYELCYFYMNEAYVSKQYDEDFVKNKNALENAYQTFHKNLGGKSDEIAIYLFYQLGNAYVRLREFQSAKKIFEEGLLYSLQNDVPEVAKYNDYAGMYTTMGEYPKAKEIFLQGISRKNMTEEDLLYTKLGYVECLAYLKDFKAGLSLNKEVEKQIQKGLISEDAKLSLPEFRANVQENYALLYEMQNQWNDAIKWYKQTYQTAIRFPLSTRRSLGLYLVFIGNLYLKQNDPNQALVYFQRALETIIVPLKKGSGENPTIDMLKAESGVLRALYGKAKACQMLGNPDLALACYELIPIVEAKLRATHFYESSSLLALKESRSRFQEAIDLAWKLYERSNGNPQYAERAFRLTELSRGMLLLQSLM